LGSNTIPWVTALSRELSESVDAALGVAPVEGATTWETLLKRVITPEYQKHFHKNWMVLPDGLNDSVPMRKVWAQCDVGHHMDPLLRPKLRAVAPDTVEYTDVRTGARSQATTLRGLLRASLPTGLGERVFNAIIEDESRLYSWKARGPAIVDRLIGVATGGSWEDRPDILLLQEYDRETETLAAFSLPPTRSDSPGVASDAGTAVPDISMRAALVRHGYGGVVFNNPVGAPSVAVYWRRDRWACAATEDDVLVLNCGESATGAAFCVDLMSSSHSQLAPAAAAGDADAAPLRRHAERELLPLRDRRCAGFVKLEPRASGGGGGGGADTASIWACTAHLMTSSRDNCAKNRFPGEVRIGELGVVCEKAAELVPPGDALLIGGDFNLDPSFLWQCAASGITPREVGGAAALDGAALATPAALDASDAADGTRELALRWSGTELREAFEVQHAWREDACARWPTSINAKRSTRIDQLWFTPSTLARVRAAPSEGAGGSAAAAAAAAVERIGRTPTAPIPCLSADGARIAEPSDHVPIAALFELRGGRATSSSSEASAL
jgi:hypothetical protein